MLLEWKAGPGKTQSQSVSLSLKAVLSNVLVLIRVELFETFGYLNVSRN